MTHPATETYSDLGTPELHKRLPVTQVHLDSERIPVAKVVIECVLDRYLERAQLVDRQHEAGIKLRRLWRQATLQPSVIGSYAPAISGGGDFTDASGARRHLAEALVEASLATIAQDAEPLIVFRVSDRGEERAHPTGLKGRLKLNQTGHTVVSVCGFDEWAGGMRRLAELRDGLTDLANFWWPEK